MQIYKAVKIKEFVLLLGDIAVLFASLFLMLFIRYGDVTDPLPQSHLIPFTLLFAGWLLIFYIAGLYDLRSLNYTRTIDEKFWPAIGVSVIFAAAFFYAFNFLPGFGIAPKTNLALFAIIAAAALYAWKTMYALFIQARGAGQRLLLIGSNPSTVELARHIERNVHFGYTLGRWIREEEQSSLTGLRSLIEEDRISIVVVSRETKKKDEDSLRLLRYLTAGMRVVPLTDIYEAIFRKTPLPEITEDDFLGLMAKRHPIHDPVKRSIEFLLSLLLIILLSPLLLAIALLIKTTSRGSAFFTQTRVGEHGRKFILWKFRTMVPDAEKNGPQWTAPNDKRITPFGKLLRATHLDELPQLWNILRGELSLVGPRPEQPEFVALLEKEIPFYQLRHLVKPGLTGWAQLNYKYGASAKDAYKKLEYDLYYIKYRSLWLELGTLLKTAKRLFVGASS